MSLAITVKSNHRLRVSRPVFIAIVFVIGCLTFFLVFASVKTHTGLATFDTPLLNWMIAHRTPALTSLMTIITNIVSPVALALVIFIGVALWSVRKKEVWRPALLVGAMGVAFITSTLIKDIVHHRRPPVAAMIPPLEVDYSFPSGHVIGIAVCLVVLGYLIYSRSRHIRFLLIWTIVAILGISVVAISRLYLGYHWLSDVSASVGLALIILAGVMTVDVIGRKKIPRLQ